MTDPESDRQLIEAALRGDADAFSILVWRWQRPLFNFLLRLSGNRELAQDLCQEAFLRAYLKLGELRERDRFASWLFRIAVNLYRSDRRKPSLELAESGSATDFLAAEGSERSPARELQLTIQGLIARLAPEQREVLILHIYHGFRFDEMASILGCPASTLKSRLYKAFEHLRGALELRKTFSSR